MLFMFVLTVHASARVFTVKSSIDSTQIWIGQQTSVHFEVTQPQNTLIRFPVFSRILVEGLEKVQPASVDTATNANGQWVVKHTYVITSFYDSLYHIPPFPFIAGNDTLWSQSLALKVIQPFVIDTAQYQIADIKGVMNPTIDWWFWIKRVLPWVLMLMAIVGVIYLIVKLLRKKPATIPEMIIPKEEAHIVALKKLDEIRKSKLWLHGREKEYHTQLTEVLREYIESIFEIPAPEMTSEEMFSHLSDLKSTNQVAWQSIKQVLTLADLVKFAKWHPATEEHEQSWSNAVLFVNNTKIIEEKVNDVS